MANERSVGTRSYRSRGLRRVTVDFVPTLGKQVCLFSDGDKTRIVTITFMDGRQVVHTQEAGIDGWEFWGEGGLEELISTAQQQ